MAGLMACLAVSAHVGMGGGWNAIHPCVRYERGPWAVGAYVNSEYAISPFVTYSIGQPLVAELGLVGGYSMAPILPTIRVGYLADQTFVFIAPGYAKGEGLGFVLGTEWRF